MEPIKLIKKLNDPEKGLAWVFQIFDYFTPNINDAMSVAFGKSSNYKERDLLAYFENFIVKKMFDKIKKAHNKSQRCMAILDISEFPIIVSYIDYRKPDNDHLDKFSDSVFNTWTKYDLNQSVPLISVNINIPSTGLKLINFNNLS